LDVDPVGVDGDRRDLEPGLLDDQALRMPAGVLQRDALDALPAQPATGER
jgi:hypothetical protein